MALAALFLCAGCGGAGYADDAPGYTVGVVLKTQDSEHWLRIRTGMEQAAAEQDARLLVTWPTDELSLREQRDMIADMLRCDIDALIVAPCDSWDCAWWSEEAAARGIPAFTADTAALDCELPYIGADNEKIGRMAAERLRDTLPAGSRVGMISGFRRQQSLAARGESFRAALAADGGLRLTGAREDCQSFSAALAAARALLAEDADAIFCTSAVLGLGAAAAARETGSGVRIVAVDTQDDALKAVETGAFDALITQPGEEIGRRAVETALAALCGESVPERVTVAGELLTADNIGAFLEKQKAGDAAWSGS